MASTVPAGPVDLAVAEAGRGGRPLLLVHGFTGAKEDFGDWLDRFAAEGWWVVAPDLRGHGASPCPDEESAYSLGAFAGDLVALVDRLGWDRFCLLGHSMGGMIAQELVLGPGDRVERLVLMDTHHGPAEGLDAETVAFGVAVVRDQGLPALLALLAELPRPAPAPSEVRLRANRVGYAEWADQKIHACSPAMYAAMALELTSRADRLAELASVSAPTQVVVGAEDHAFLGAAHRMAESVPGATLAVILDAAHSPQFENPDAWWQAVAPFLATELLVD
ncbi:alpha/beta hydrolase [soil metagenome]